MATLESLRQHIAATEDLQSLIRSMKSLAAANVHHLEALENSINAFRHTVDLGFQALFQIHTVHELTTANPQGADILVAFGSDRGLCGNFNEMVVELTARHVARRHAEEARVHLVVIGAIAATMLHDAGIVADEVIAMPGTIHGLGNICEAILIFLDDKQKAAPIAHVETIFNTRMEDDQTRPRAHVLLPIPLEHLRALQRSKWPSRGRPTFSVPADVLFSQLIRQHLFMDLMHAGLSSMVSENSARLAAMNRADKRMGETLQALTANYRHLRQDAITSELLDLVSGYEVLRDRGPS